MGGGKNLGFFWGSSSFRIVETENNLAARISTIPLDPGPGSIDMGPDDVRITALIQKAIRDERITATQVKLSLPSTDTIIRSFLIPWMRPNEITAAVEFEIKKYIPFNLKDLAYAYHSITFTENKVKKVRIIFVAVRRELLERCTQILKQAELNVVFCEAAPLSLVRALSAKKFLPHDQKIALLQVEPAMGRILFTHEGIVLFIREFQMNARKSDGTSEEAQFIRSRFLNEVQNSMEFYNRQYLNQPVTQVVVLASPSENPYHKWLQEDLNLPIKSVDPAALVGSQPPGDEMGAVNAFGVALASPGHGKAIFDLAGKSVTHTASLLSSIDFREYMNAVKTAVICAVVLGLVFILTQAGLAGLKNEVNGLEARQSQEGFAGQADDFRGFPGSPHASDDMQAKIKKNKAKLASYKSILIKSKMALVFAHIPSLFPEGVWLRTFNVRKSTDSNGYWTVDLNGYAYVKDTKQEIRTVNELVARIKKDQHVGKYFKSVNLTNLQQQVVDGYTVADFTINCT